MSKSGYTDDLRIIKSLLIVTSLQKRKDIKAIEAIRKFSKPLSWKPLQEFMIDADVWRYAAKKAMTRKRYFVILKCLYIIRQQVSIIEVYVVFP